MSVCFYYFTLHFIFLLLSFFLFFLISSIFYSSFLTSIFFSILFFPFFYFLIYFYTSSLYFSFSHEVNDQNLNRRDRNEKLYYNSGESSPSSYVSADYNIQNIPNMPGMPGMFFGSYPVPPPPPYMNVGAPHMGNMQMVTSYPIVLNTQTGQMQWANTPTNPLPVSTGGHVQQHISHNNQSGMRVQGSDGIHSNNRHKNKHNNNNNNHHNNNNSYNNAQRENHAHDNHLRRTNPRGMGFQNQVQVPSNNNEFYQQPYLPHSQINYQNMNMNMNNGIYPYPGVSQQQYYYDYFHC